MQVPRGLKIGPVLHIVQRSHEFPFPEPSLSLGCTSPSFAREIINVEIRREEIKERLTPDLLASSKIEILYIKGSVVA